MVLKRKVTSELMTTYFPTLLLTAITFATTFFKPFFFEAALMVNLTTMLVMTTIFMSKMEGLPPTSDIKMIDIWLILCQIYPFVEVVLLTAMEYRREEENEQKSDIQIIESISIVEENETPKTSLEKLAHVFSRWSPPGLKTLGKLCTNLLKATDICNTKHLTHLRVVSCPTRLSSSWWWRPQIADFEKCSI